MSDFGLGVHLHHTDPSLGSGASTVGHDDDRELGTQNQRKFEKQ